MFSEFDFAALKAILVARAVLPIEGLPAKTIKSDLFKPPKNPFNLLKPVSTPGNSENEDDKKDASEELLLQNKKSVDESKDKIPQTDDLKDENTKMEVSEVSSKNEDEDTKLDN